MVTEPEGEAFGGPFQFKTIILTGLKTGLTIIIILMLTRPRNCSSLVSVQKKHACACMHTRTRMHARTKKYNCEVDSSHAPFLWFQPSCWDHGTATAPDLGRNRSGMKNNVHVIENETDGTRPHCLPTHTLCTNTVPQSLVQYCIVYIYVVHHLYQNQTDSKSNTATVTSPVG